MKKILNYLLFISIFTVCFITNTYAAIVKDDIDWKNETITYDETNEEFKLVSNTSEGTLTYQWIQVSDGGSELTTAYNDFKNALSTNDESSINDKETTLLTLLNTSAINDNNWSASKNYSGTLIPNGLYIKWVKFTPTNSATSPIYAFTLYKVNSTGQTSTVTNPDTGVNPLYIVPILLICGSILVFKKRRYE